MNDKMYSRIPEMHKRESFQGLSVINAKFKKFRPVRVRVSTVSRVLTKNEIKSYVAVCKPYLTQTNKNI